MSGRLVGSIISLPSSRELPPFWCSLHVSTLLLSIFEAAALEDQEMSEDEGEDDVRPNGRNLPASDPCLCGKVARTSCVQCDNCSTWFHFRCVGLASDIADNMSSYVCPTCVDTADDD